MKLPIQIDCFLMVAEHHSFTIAADILHITPTAVSKQIKNLEADLGEQLFIRTTRTVILTEIGEILYQRCKALANEVLSIQQFVKSKKLQPGGKIKVLVSTITSKSFVSKHLASFMMHYPLIQPEIIFSEEDSALSHKDIDIMIGFPTIPPYTDQLKYRKIFEVKNILCASPNYIEKYGEPIKIEDLLQAKIISHTLRKDNFNFPLANGECLQSPAPIMLMNNFDALNQACIEGIGLLLTGDTLVADEIKSGKLKQVLPDIEFAKYEIFMFYRHYDYELPTIRAFVDYFFARI